MICLCTLPRHIYEQPCKWKLSKKIDKNLTMNILLCQPFFEGVSSIYYHKYADNGSYDLILKCAGNRFKILRDDERDTIMESTVWNDYLAIKVAISIFWYSWCCTKRLLSWKSNGCKHYLKILFNRVITSFIFWKGFYEQTQVII